MKLLDIVMIALGLSMDAFAVSIAAGTSSHMSGKRAAFRISFHFGLFQFFMPVIGWISGNAVERIIASVDHWIAFLLLTVVGGRMIKSAFQNREDSFKRDPSRGLTLIVLSLATSIDAFAVGMSLAILKVRIWFPSILIGIITGSLSLLGISMGNFLGRSFGKGMEILGGLILITIGIRILLSHLIL